MEEGLLAQLDFDKLTQVAATGAAVLPVVLQHGYTGEVLFVGYANRQAVQATLAEQRAVLWSTSRNELWRKGETSGDVLTLIDVRINCEQNSLLYRVCPSTGGVCHTKSNQGETRLTCYYRALTSVDELTFVNELD